MADEFRQRHVPYADAFRKLDVQTIPIVSNLLNQPIACSVVDSTRLCCGNQSYSPIKIPPLLVKITMLKASHWPGNDIVEQLNWELLLRQIGSITSAVTVIRCSMDSRSADLDNIFAKRLWRSLKYEAVYLPSWPTVFMPSAVE